MAAAHTEGTEVTSWQWSLDTTPEGLVLRLSGSWRMQDGLPSPALARLSRDIAQALAALPK